MLPKETVLNKLNMENKVTLNLTPEQAADLYLLGEVGRCVLQGVSGGLGPEIDFLKSLGHMPIVKKVLEGRKKENDLRMRLKYPELFGED